MDKDLKRLVVEIISIILLLIVVVPICVNASSRYNEQKEVLLNGAGTSVDISSNGDMKRVTIYSNYDRVMRVNLIFKISKFSNDYNVSLDGRLYNIDDFQYVEDDEYRYYKLGIYEVDKVRSFDFKLSINGRVYYDETIIYSFITEGLL